MATKTGPHGFGRIGESAPADVCVKRFGFTAESRALTARKVPAK